MRATPRNFMERLKLCFNKIGGQFEKLSVEKLKENGIYKTCCNSCWCGVESGTGGTKAARSKGEEVLKENIQKEKSRR